VVVDPFSTGALLSKLIQVGRCSRCGEWHAVLFTRLPRSNLQDRGYHVIRVCSSGVSEELLSLVPESCKGLSFVATIQHTTDVDETVAKLRELNGSWEIVSIMVGCESVRQMRWSAPQLVC
jgi:hypothetical protein